MINVGIFEGFICELWYWPAWFMQNWVCRFGTRQGLFGSATLTSAFPVSLGFETRPIDTTNVAMRINTYISAYGYV